MGSGKTTWAISHLKSHPLENDLYITPFLTETDRIVTATSGSKRFVTPENKGQGKLSSLNTYLSNEDDIASTHELFKHLNEESRAALSQSGYTLILDEVLEVISPYNIKSGDLQLLLDGDWISIDQDGFIVWNSDKSGYDSTFEEVKLLAENRSLICVNGTILLWRYPPEIFNIFEKIYILTYLFEASILCAYFRYNGITYEKKTICKTDSGYELTDFSPFNPSVFKPLINIYQGPLNKSLPQKRSCMSKVWYGNPENVSYVKQLKDNLYNYLRNVQNAKASDIMWTCFKDDKPRLKGKGYSNSFVACNSRSTNEYGNRHALAYMVNRYLNPGIPVYFAQQGVTIANELFALSEMIQWVWRSAIRNGEEISIYIASDRMRELFESWLNGDKIQVDDMTQ